MPTQSAEPFVRSYNPFNPAFRDTLRSGINELIGGREMGGTPTQRYRAGMADLLTGAVDFAPGIGDAVGVADTVQAARGGNYGTAAMLGGATMLGMLPVVGDAASAALKKMTRSEFLGSPKIVGAFDASELRPRAIGAVEDAPAEEFIHGLTLRKSPGGAAVFDGDKVVASYNFGNTLVVDPKYRKKGIAEELVYRWRSAYPEPATARTRTKVSQKIQENVWERMQREQASAPLEGTLDMSQAARMQRAAEQGFNVDMPVYHGTRSDIQEFSVQDQVRNRKSDAPPGVFFFSSSPEIAGSYSASSRSKAGAANIIPANLRLQNPLVVDAKGNPWSQIELNNDFMSKIDPRRFPAAQNKLPDGSGMDRMLTFSTNELAEIARRSGNYDGMVIRNVYDPGTLRTKAVSDTYAVFDPANIRSINAAFDPSKRGSANLMAGAAGATIGLSALRNIQREEEPQPD